jgi:hypothetical protein
MVSSDPENSGRSFCCILSMLRRALGSPQSHPEKSFYSDRMELTAVGSASDSSTDAKNAGAQVTCSQQVKILLSTSLASFTVVGKAKITSTPITGLIDVELT